MQRAASHSLVAVWARVSRELAQPNPDSSCTLTSVSEPAQSGRVSAALGPFSPSGLGQLDEQPSGLM